MVNFRETCAAPLREMIGIIQRRCCALRPPVVLLLLSAFTVAPSLAAVQGVPVAELVLTAEPQDMVVLPGRPALLNCEAEARSAAHIDTQPVVSWRGGDGQTLSFIGDTYRSKLPNGSLYISAFGEEDDVAPVAEYQCLVSLEGVGSVVSRTARLQLATPAKIVQQPADLRVFPGQTAHFACVTQPVPGPGRAAGPHAAWLRNDRPLLLDPARMLVMPSGALEIDEVQASDQGAYQCNATGPASGVLSSKASLTINMDIEAGESIMAPVFIATPRSTEVMAGKNVTLDCAANGNPRPEISWLKDGITIDMAHLDSRFRKVGTGSLQVLNVEESDAGDYQCRAENREDSVDASATLEVLVPPRFIKQPQNKVAVEKDDLELECEVYGKPEPKVYWVKNGDIITQNEYIQVVGGYNLRILGLMSMDSGIFQCIATNPAGNIQAAARLTVVSSESEISSPDNTSSTLPPRFTVSSSSSSSSSLKIHNTLSSRALPRPSHAPPPLHSEPHDIFDPYNNDDDDDDDENDDDADDGDDDDDEYDGELDATNTAGGDSQSGSFDEVRGSEIPMRLPGTPSEPRDLEAVIVTTRFVTLRWKEPEEKNGDIDTYSVFYRQDGSQRERVMNTSRSRLEEANVPGLQPDRKYDFRVVAYNQVGMGPSSPTITVTTAPEVHVPSPPLDLVAIPLSPKSILIKWRPPVNSDGPILNYRLFYMEGESAEEHHVETSETHYELTDLEEYTEYCIWVIATNKNGQGASTEEVTARTLSAPPSDYPQNVTLEAAGSTSVTVRWEPPPKEGQNGIITGYKLRYRKKDRRSGKGDTVTAAGNRRLYTLTDLERGSVYNVRLYAINVNGTGPPTEWYTIETYQKDLDESSVPDIPAMLKLRPMVDSMQVSWLPPRDQNIKVRGYTIGWGKGVPDVYSQLLDDKARTYTIEELEPNSEYVISVRAFNEVGDGQPRYESNRTREESTPEPMSPLIPPVGLKAIVLSATSVVVYWTDTTLSQSQFVTDNRYYVVRYTSFHLSQRYKNTTNLNCMIDDLKPHTQYEFTVKVAKGRRQSPWSMVVLNTTLEDAPASSPRDLTVVGVDNHPSSVNLNWQPPNKPNGEIKGYTIYYTTDITLRDRDWVVESVTGDKMTTTIKGLTPSTTYFFKIQARNSKGPGPFSSTVSLTTSTSSISTNDVGAMSKENRGLNGTMLVYVIVGVVGLIILVAVIGVTVVCCKRSEQGQERSKKGYMKGNTKTSKPDIKPPDLWIHHDQMELKNMDKCGNNHGNPSGETSSSSSHTLATTLPRSGVSNTHQDYSSDGPPKYQHHTNSLDKRNYISSYVGNSLNHCDEKSSTTRHIIKAKPIISLPVDCEPLRESVATATPIPNGNMPQSQTDGRPHYPRTQYSMARAHVTMDPSGQTSESPYSLQGGYDTVSSIPGGVGAPGPPILHHTPNHTSTYSPGLNAQQLPPPLQVGQSPASQPGLATVQECNSSSSSSAGSTVGSTIGPSVGNAGAKRLQGHPLKSFSVPAPPPPPQSAPCSVAGVSVRPHQGSSPYKKPNLVATVTAVPIGGSRVGAINPTMSSGLHDPGRLQPSYSTEELNQEMANLEGLMKDLNAITASEFEC
ncbi:netrin receptor DCC isoform X2 [Frankliniella occidentalis]|uniref:Netrin receptor DCC isoform X2 n=1 Tax=Frankliniella occidentalis TaxID=133901 RepID=A0A6J1T3Z1_FRAOC|nr:netrin receptor DCC isoform X2 [Frankliniella occidentalis]